MKKMTLILIITSLSFLLSISAHANNNLTEIYMQLNLTQDEIQFLEDNRSFTYAITTDYAPIEYIDSTGTPRGFGVEYLNYTSKLLGIEFVPIEGFETLSWHDCYTLLSNGKIDLLPAITYTEKRKTEVLFTKPYLELNCIVIGDASSRIILNKKDLVDSILTFPTTYWQNDYFKKLYPNAAIINTEDIHSSLKLIDKGDADYTFMESTVYNYYNQRYHYKSLGIVGELSIVIDQRIGVRKNNALLVSILDKVIDYAPKDEINGNAIYIEFVEESNRLLVAVLILSTLLLTALSYILYRKFKKSQQREKYLLKTREQLFESLAHDLKNPMCMVKANLDLIKYDIIKENELKDHLKLIYSNVDTINSIVDDLYELTSFKESILLKEFMEIRIGKFLHDIYVSNQSLFAHANKELQLIHDKETYHATVNIEPISFRRAVNNLLFNAYKYTNEDGKVKISYYSDKNYIYISVWDNGIGIPKNMTHNIFNRFYRINSSHTENTIGKGIGLSVVQEVIKLHHGSIHVKSIEGMETEFTIQIPQL